MQTIAVCFPFYLKAKASGVNTSLQGELWSPKNPTPKNRCTHTGVTASAKSDEKTSAPCTSLSTLFFQLFL